MRGTCSLQHGVRRRRSSETWVWAASLLDMAVSMRMLSFTNLKPAAVECEFWLRCFSFAWKAFGSGRRESEGGREGGDLR